MAKKTDKPATIAEVQENISKLRIELHEAQHAGATGKHKNVHAPRMIRKDIARLLTQQAALEKKA